MAPLKLETAIRAFRGRFFAISFLLNWLWIGFLNDCFYGLELLAVQLFEHADRAAGTSGDDNHRRPQEEIPFFLGVVGLVLMPLPRLGHPRRCRPQRWRCPDLGHPFTRFLAAKGCPATRRITRFQWRYYEGREALTHPIPGRSSGRTARTFQ